MHSKEIPRLYLCCPLFGMSHFFLIVGTLCPESWTHYRGSCYSTTRVAQGLTWVEAEQQCERQGAHLTSIMDEEEMQVINYLIIMMLGTQEAKVYIGEYCCIKHHTK